MARWLTCRQQRVVSSLRFLFLALLFLASFLPFVTLSVTERTITPSPLDENSSSASVIQTLPQPPSRSHPPTTITPPPPRIHKQVQPQAPPSSSNSSTASTTLSQKPYFILHMGPDKTGSTSLQDFLQTHGSLLQHDGYDVTFSKNTVRKLRDKKQLFNVLLTCLSQDKFTKHPCHRHNSNMQGKLQSLVRHLTTKVERPNVFLSNEGFRWARFSTHPDWAWFVAQLQKYYEISVVLVYRRYYDWLSSRYQEDNRHSEWTGMAFLKWPEEGGRTVHSLLEYIELDLQLQCAKQKKKKKRDVTCEAHFANRIQVLPDGISEQVGHPLLEMAKPLLLSQHNISVQIINFHAPRDLVEAILCETLRPTVEGRKTTHTCETLQQDHRVKQQKVLDVSQEPPTTQSSSSSSSSRQTNVLSIQYDRIGLEAHRLGILAKSVARNSAKAVIAKYLKANKANKDDDVLLPWICPSPDVLDRLERISFQLEQDLLAMDIGRSLEKTFPESHAGAFAKALANKRFCEVNVTQVLLEDPAFREYLASQK